jgi:hypothetical protein
LLFGFNAEMMLSSRQTTLKAVHTADVEIVVVLKQIRFIMRCETYRSVLISDDTNPSLVHHFQSLNNALFEEVGEELFPRDFLVRNVLIEEL